MGWRFGCFGLFLVYGFALIVLYVGEVAGQGMGADCLPYIGRDGIRGGKCWESVRVCCCVYYMCMRGKWWESVDIQLLMGINKILTLFIWFPLV